MRFLAVLQFVLGFAVLAGAETPASNANRADSAKNDKEEAQTTAASLQGSWVCVWDQRDGKVGKRQIGSIFVFDGEEMTHRFPDGQISRWRFQLHANTEPQQIDWSHANSSDVVDQGILWLKGDTLVFCDGLPLGRPPNHFADASHLNVLVRDIAHAAPNSAVNRTTAPHKQLTIRENAWVTSYEFVISARRNRDDPVATRIQLQEGESFIIEPDRKAQWGAHGPDGPLADYRGLGRTDSLLTLFFRVGESSAPVTAGRPITVISPGQLELYCQDSEPWNNIGHVAVKVVRLKTNK